jgi:ATP-dependent RNA helicase DeaD
MTHTFKPEHNKESQEKKPNKFAELGLSDRALATVNRMGFEEPSDIQKEFIPAALTGKDCVGQAKTGTGKTVAFLLPIFEHYFKQEKVRTLILAPTRELASQIHTECEKLTGKYAPNSTAIYGGTPIKKQINKLKNNPEIVVGTPGRILDHINRRTLSLSKFSIVVLDEVDHMFDMGFRKDISRIIRECKNRKQTLFLSATMPKDIMKFGETFLKDPIRISVIDDSPAVETLEQKYFSVTQERKSALLTEIVKRHNPTLSIVFTRTKRGAEKLGRNLKKKGISATFIHGDLPQRKRKRIVDEFRKGKYQILVATDLMGRGIDVPDISHIINYDIPQNPEDYLHRIGRSGRMNTAGIAYTFVTPKDGGTLNEIEMLCNRLIDCERLENFDNGIKPRRR